MKKILVIGATGMLGQPVVGELLKAGFSVTALVRNEHRAQQLLPDEVSLFRGDLRNPIDIEQALEGMEGVYLNLSVRPGERRTGFHTENEGLQTLLPLARAAGIQRIGYLASLVQHYQGMDNFNWWVFDLKQRATRLIRESGIP
ncbi:SDR family oxidoreductase, partial [Cesiribacter andamanensis]|uniref:SDR family oxidoreductase n=1 Tax=Cesiribacter andamanensis TaxID=649507 RepID=UPI00058C98D9